MTIEILNKNLAKVKLNRTEVFEILKTSLLQIHEYKPEYISGKLKENYGSFVADLLDKGFEFDTIEERIEKDQYDNEYLDEIIITLYKKTEAKK